VPTPKIFVDVFCEIHDVLSSIAAGDFYNFSDVDIEPGAVYVIGRNEWSKNQARIRDIVENKVAHIVFSNPAEGSTTMLGQLHHLGISDLAITGQIMILAGSEMDPAYRVLPFENFLHRMVNFEENIQCISHTEEIYNKVDKPYLFLMLNGRMRPHRKWMIEAMRQSGLLDKSLYTNLDTGNPQHSVLSMMVDGIDHMAIREPIKYLEPRYEVDLYKDQISIETSISNVKFHLFKNEWGEAYIKPAPYIDTYFSIVNETVFENKYSFRTEKIWKPIIMGQPWIAVANAGFYKDIRNLGFKTFDNVIDESFDLITDNQLRIEKIKGAVVALCASNLPEFMLQCKSACLHNQAVMLEYQEQHAKEFPQKFISFVRENIQ
jgi:hypothetical protein